MNECQVSCLGKIKVTQTVHNALLQTHRIEKMYQFVGKKGPWRDCFLVGMSWKVNEKDNLENMSVVND
jgi:hypothetical protein